VVKYKDFLYGGLIILEKVAISDTLAARRDAIAKLNLWLRIWAADKPNAVSFRRFTVRYHVNAALSVCDGPSMEQNTEGG